ncbi:unnamed protein product [Spirodela intermedia]|uniref:Choline transporter-like protein n=1 Tax=Spirodela intermedia TaxID=51605 RepID=A0A7I8ID20_SPIIN|nr:unnamed protein product [Spirodela intermedia]CAA6655656.1 unnamed protein product [Spirodela intermedia]
MGGPLGAIIGRYPTGGERGDSRVRESYGTTGNAGTWCSSSFSSPSGLNYGLDYKGNICGDKHADPDLRELEVRYWMNPNQIYQSGVKDSQFKLADARSVCLMECPTPSEDGISWVCDYPEGDIKISTDDWIDRDYDYYDCQFIARASNVSLRHWQQMGGVEIEDNILIDRAIHRPSTRILLYVADIGKAWPVLIVCGAMLPLFLSIIWLLMIRHFVSAMTWITVGLFNSSLYHGLDFLAGWIGNDAISAVIGESDPYYTVTGRELNHMRAVAVLMTLVMIVAILSSIAIVRRILMATSVLKVAAKVIGEVQALIIFPTLPYVILVIFFMFWASAALHLFSSGQIIRNECNVNCCSYDLKSNRHKYTPHITVAILFHLFGCFWVTQFIIASSSTVIAGSVASYYWTRGEVSEIPFLPVFSSLKRFLRYSIGSVALGSLIVSIVESIRFILESIRRRLKFSDTVSESWMGRATSFSSQCCLGCIEWTIKSVNRNAYIMIAITGKGFFKASSIATGLIMNNILRIGKVNVIGDVILFLGKLCISLFCTVFAFLMLDNHKFKSAHNKVSSPLFPVLVCWALGYIVATLFFAVVEMAIDTIILSFCQDAEEHQGTAQYAPPLLMETLEDQGEMQRLTQGS